MRSASLILAALVVVVLVLAVYAACSGGSGRGSEPFLGTMYYAPSCGADWGGRRRADCRGITTGVMPSIEVGGIGACGLGCGRLGGLGGVPP